MMQQAMQAYWGLQRRQAVPSRVSSTPLIVVAATAAMLPGIQGEVAAPAAGLAAQKQLSKAAVDLIRLAVTALSCLPCTTLKGVACTNSVAGCIATIM
jgi:hypothetical protein